MYLTIIKILAEPVGNIKQIGFG